MLFVEDARGIFVVVGVVGGCRRILFAHDATPDRSHCGHTVTTAGHRPLDVERL